MAVKDDSTKQEGKGEVMSILHGPQFLFKCSDCEYHAAIKGLWAVITRYPDQSLYSFLCVDCDAKQLAKKARVNHNV